MQEKNRKNRKKKVALISALLALFAILAGTFAWTSYTEWVKNHMQSKGFEGGRVAIVENFDPPPIDPNAKVKKEVNVVNSSSHDAFVRISFEEMLHTLTTGADGKGYALGTDAGFPIIITTDEYLGAGSTYTDETANLLIKDTANGTTQTPPAGLKLYVSADGTKAGLFIERAMLANEFPEDFDFLVNNNAVPVISGSFANGDAVVAQKVTGNIVKTTSGWEVYTNEYADETKDFRIWGYGVGLAAKLEADWAGVNVNVTATVASPGATAYNSSAIAGSGITFTMPNVVTTLPGAPTSTWYYDAASGYFYYLDVLTTSQTTLTSIMDEISFPDDQRYNIASYNMYVGLEAIPAAKSALTATSTFGAFTGTPTVEGNSSWESNDSGWGLTAGTPLYDYYAALATLVE